MFYRIIFASWLIHLIFIIPAVHAKPIRYVAIGDSYTVATGIEEKDSWPSQLTRKLTSAGIEIDLVATLGQRGWTSQQVIEGKLPLLKDLKPDFITLLIGVNDWIREGTNNQSFTVRIKNLIDGIQNALSMPDQLLIVTIPDFSCSPRGKTWGYGKSATNGITRLNKILKTEAGSRGLHLVDIYPLSQKLCTGTAALRSQLGMFAGDDLHPSALQYSRWVDLIFPDSLDLLKPKPIESTR